MEMEKNWHVNAPWAQLVVSTETVSYTHLRAHETG